MLLSMLCWGSWANTMKACPGYRFQLFYWDYVLGLIAGALLWGFTLGSLGSSGRSFIADLLQADHAHLGLAIAGGVIFNVANLLLVAAIEIAGLAVAFPIGIGLALVVGAVSSYVLSPAGNPMILFSGIALVVAAIVLDALAYRLREAQQKSLSMRGVLISLIAGLLMQLLPFCLQGDDRRPCAGALRHCSDLCSRCCAMCVAVQLSLDEEASGQQCSSCDGGLLEGAGSLACMGRGWGRHLVHRRGFQFCGIARQYCGTGGIVLYRPGGDYDLGRVGSIYLERICAGPAEIQNLPRLDVSVIHLRIDRDCSRTGTIGLDQRANSMTKGRCCA
jgi:Ureide permease